jgi:hypothetical protein
MRRTQEAPPPQKKGLRKMNINFLSANPLPWVTRTK